MSWGRVRGRALVLPPGTEEDAVSEFAEGSGSEKIHEVTAAPELGLTREVTWRLSPGHFLHYGRETPSGRSFVEVSGDDAEAVERMTDILVEYFEPLTDEDLIAAVDAAESVEDLRR